MSIRLKSRLWMKAESPKRRPMPMMMRQKRQKRQKRRLSLPLPEQKRDAMELLKEIGRYKFSVLSVVAVIAQDDGNFEFILPHNVRLMLTPDEKRQYDEAIEFHN